MLRRVSCRHETVFVRPQRKDRGVGAQGRAQRRDCPALRGRSRHRQTLLQAARRERGTLQARKAPGKKHKLDEKAIKLLAKDLEQRPWATHSQRAEFLFALSGVRVSEATVCRAVRRLRRNRKKIQRGSRTRQVLKKSMAHGGRRHRSRASGSRGRDGRPHLWAVGYAS
jgi:transposase